MISGRINQVAVVSLSSCSPKRKLNKSLLNDQTIIKRFYNCFKTWKNGFHLETTRFQTFAAWIRFSNLTCQVCLVNLQSTMAKLMIFHIVFQISTDKVGFVYDTLVPTTDFLLHRFRIAYSYNNSKTVLNHFDKYSSIQSFFSIGFRGFWCPFGTPSNQRYTRYNCPKQHKIA